MTSREVSDLIAPLSARSVIASTLLGTHPPRMSGRLLAAFGERFEISPGTIRVALSRMVDRGELTNDGGVYELSGSLLERQQRQDERRQDHHRTWDGSWEQAVVVRSGRAASERGKLRDDLGALGLGELREGVWMRPANLDPKRSPLLQKAVADQVRWLTVAPEPIDAARQLVADLFDLDIWASVAAALTDALETARDRLATDDGALVDGFMLAAGALRHFVHDPVLPVELEPEGWPAISLRRAYEGFQADYGKLLREFFRRQ